MQPDDVLSSFSAALSVDQNNSQRILKSLLVGTADAAVDFTIESILSHGVRYSAQPSNYIILSSVSSELRS